MGCGPLLMHSLLALLELFILRAGIIVLKSGVQLENEDIQGGGTELTLIIAMTVLFLQLTKCLPRGYWVELT